jgi:ribosome biogenesis GTPase
LSFPYRIASDRGSSFIALGPDGAECAVTLPPSPERPAVGDYVALDEAARITAVAPRRGVLARARADRGHAAQIVAAHLDTVFIVTAPGRDFSPPRVERYLTAARAGGIASVIVLNKSDLADDLAALRLELAIVAGDAPVLAVSAVTGAGCEALDAYAAAGKTLALVGSSGVGKSTLANRFAGTERVLTGAVREDDGRGQHTTTRRELIALPSGAWLIDTPGMRAFAPWADAEALAEVFSDIEEAAGRCRFRDCAHAGEPRCAVEAEIDPRRVERWRALRAELAYLDRRDDPGLVSAERKIWKARSKAQRQRAALEGKS